MWQLDARGLAPTAGVDGEERPAEADPVLPASDTLILRFSGSADGRGFSTARRLRSLGYRGRLIAAGPLVPDQARHALQSGFDALLIEDDTLARHGELSWRNALARAPGSLYVADPTSRGGERSIWQARHS